MKFLFLILINFTLTFGANVHAMVSCETDFNNLPRDISEYEELLKRISNSSNMQSLYIRNTILHTGILAFKNQKRIIKVGESPSLHYWGGEFLDNLRERYIANYSYTRDLYFKYLMV